MSQRGGTLARAILEHLAESRQKLVCAESCTAGLIAATLASIPGASRFLCGSAVVYRDDTKTHWLEIPREVLEDEARGDVCAETAERMASGVLKLTPEANIALSITGHLGPNSPLGLDGVAFIGWAQRSDEAGPTQSERIQLASPAPDTTLTLDHQIDLRVARQREAVERALQFALQQLRATPLP